MKSRWVQYSWIAMLIIGMMLITGCVIQVGDYEVQVGDPEVFEVGELRHEVHSVPYQDFDTYRVEILMGFGELDVEAGSRELLDAEFTYNVDEWAPEVVLESVDGEGTLIVRQTFEGVTASSGARNGWSLQLNDEIPTDLNVKLGAGENNLDLVGLQLTNLDIEMGAGELNLDLSGDWSRDFSAVLTRGVGEATILLPSEAGVRVTITSGIGTVVGLGLERQGDAYVNEAYGESDVTIMLDIVGAVGSIDLEVVE
ncbi:MAG: hypothetical protein GTO18_18315 [Anaerolineales bacterium]|nr:hypothetical protein [Anaerolineales bacterium]